MSLVAASLALAAPQLSRNVRLLILTCRNIISMNKQNLTRRKNLWLQKPL